MIIPSRRTGRVPSPASRERGHDCLVDRVLGCRGRFAPSDSLARCRALTPPPLASRKERGRSIVSVPVCRRRRLKRTLWTEARCAYQPPACPLSARGLLSGQPVRPCSGRALQTRIAPCAGREANEGAVAWAVFLG